MILRKGGFRRPKIESGQVEWVMGILCLTFLGVLFCAFLQMEIFRTSARYLEDALAASNLASAVIDVEEYGISHRVWIEDPEEAFATYQEAVKGNLGLDDNWNCVNHALASGPIHVVNYTIYNVSGNDVYGSSFDEAGNRTDFFDQIGSATAPNGKEIEHTGVYSEIKYDTEGLFGIAVEAHKGKLADVVAEGN